MRLEGVVRNLWLTQKSKKVLEIRPYPDKSTEALLALVVRDAREYHPWMRFETVNALKEELRGLPAAQAVGGFQKVAGHRLPEPKSLGVALGVAPGDGEEEFRLAVRTTQSNEAVSKYLDTLNLITSGEIEVQHVGDIQVVPPVQTSASWRQRHRPLHPGFSVGHRNSTAGTIGAFVEKKGSIHILSNNHVLALNDAGQQNDLIVQPGPYDGGTHPADSVARLSYWVPLQGAGNLVDAAIGVIDHDIDFEATYNGQKLGPTVTPDIGMGAWKVGRTSSVTHGKVTAIGMDDVRVRISSTQVVYFDDQIELASDSGLFSQGGDSGSLILTEGQNSPFGLLFAGSQLSGKTYANRLEHVLGLTGTKLLEYSV